MTAVKRKKREPKPDQFEYRVTWASSSMYHFKGESDWNDWDGDAADPEGIEEELTRGGMDDFPRGLEEVLEASGFDWGVEIREKGIEDA